VNKARQVGHGIALLAVSNNRLPELHGFNLIRRTIEPKLAAAQFTEPVYCMSDLPYRSAVSLFSGHLLR